MADWTLVEAIFEQALPLDGPARRRLLTERCGDDDALRAEVESLLAEAPGDVPPTLDAEAGDDVTTNGASYEPVAGTRIAEYAVQRPIGRGAMGVVYAADQPSLQRTVALKIVRARSELADGALNAYARAVSRLAEEAEILGRLDHPGIVPIHQTGTADDGRRWFTMRLVEGEDLTSILRERAVDRSAWPLSRVVMLLQRVCETMAFAHERGVLHRDLKPSHVMVGRFGEVYVVDWGLARAIGRGESKDIRIRDEGDVSPGAESTRDGDALRTIDGDVIGTPAYMAPEQAHGRLGQLGPGADVYAVGAMLYHLLAGHPPFTEGDGPRTSHDVLERVRRGPPAPLDPSPAPELAAICGRAMARDPGDRYASMDELSRDLQAFLEDRTVQAYEGGPLVQLRAWTRRNRPTAVTAAASLAVLVLGSLVTACTVTHANSQLQDAEHEAQQQAAAAIVAREHAEERADELALVLDAERARRLATDRGAMSRSIAQIEDWLTRARELERRHVAHVGALDAFREEVGFDPIEGWQHATEEDALFDRMLFELVTIGRSLPFEIEAMERALRDARRHERGELPGLTALEDLEAGRLERPFDLLTDDTAFEALFARTAPERIVDGRKLLFEPTEELAEGCTYVFPEGTFDLTAATRAWGYLSDFPVDITIAGAGPDVTRLVFSDFGPRAPLVRFTLRDATLDCDDDGLFDHRNQPSVVTMDRVRVVRHDAGHGGAQVLDTHHTLIRMRDSVIEGGYGRSPQHAQLHDVRTSAFLGRFERCVFRQIDTEFSSVRDGAALAFIDCAFEDLLEDPEDATARWNRDALAFEGCAFSFADEDHDLRTRTFALASAAQDTPDAETPSGEPAWVTVLEHTFDEARVRRPPGQGAMGASSAWLDLDPTRRVRGLAIVEVLDRGAACLFVAVSGVDPVIENTIPGNLRAVFITLDGSRHEVQAQAGGAHGLLFHSPDEIPLEQLSRCVVQRAADAPWLDG